MTSRRPVPPATLIASAPAEPPANDAAPAHTPHPLIRLGPLAPERAERALVVAIADLLVADLLRHRGV